MIGGGETQARLLAEGLTAHGHSVVVLTRRTDAELRRHEIHGHVSVYRLAPVGSGQLKKWGLLLSSLPAFVLLRDRYDLIFVSGYRIIGLTAVLIGKLLGKSVVLKADSQGEMSGKFFESGLKKFGLSHSSKPFRLFIRLRNLILKNADAFSAISSEIASEWTSCMVPLKKIYMIPNGVDITRFAPVNAEQKSILRDKLKLPQAAFIAIYAGRLVSYKGLPLLLRVWNAIRCRHENVLLLVAGTGGLDMHNCEAQLHEYVTSVGLEKEVVFLGAVQNVQEYLQAADLFAFPTENDAFPSAIVEAMACALPVVTTPVGAVKSIVTHRETGLLVQPRNFEQLFDALDVMLSDQQWAARLGQSAWQAVHDQYAAENITRQYVLLFQDALQSEC